MKKTAYLQFRVSDPLKETLTHQAAAEQREATGILLDALLAYLSERGVPIPSDCPEYRVLEAAHGTANAHLAALMESVLPLAREKSADWAASHAEDRFQKAWARVLELDEPRLFNDAVELFSDPKRTPREKIRALEFRLQSFAEKPGGL